MSKEPEFTIDNWMVAWTPGKPEDVRVGRWPDKTGWSRAYDQTAGCCELERDQLRPSDKVAIMFIDFHTLTVRDRMDAQAVHREFMKIDDYRRYIAPDTLDPETGRAVGDWANRNPPLAGNA